MGSCSELRLGVDCFLKSHLCCRGDVVLGVPVGEIHACCRPGIVLESTRRASK